VNNTSATPIWSADHLPFGEAVNETHPENDPGLRDPGQWTIPEAEGLGLPEMYYNLFRWYVPGWGRYGQADPIGLRGGMNLFGYVKGNPLRFVDPFGLATCSPWEPVGSPYSSKENVYRETWWINATGWVESLLTWRLPGRGPMSDGHICCPRDWYDLYYISNQNVKRRCDCNASPADRREAGATNITITDSWPYLEDGCCKFIQQYGLEEQGRTILKEFDKSGYGRCYQLQAGQECNGRQGGA
jgi:RHS repeat-associated protein